MRTFDFDDFHETNHKLDRLHELKALNPAFRCTLFAVPALGSPSFWESVPDWCELAVHGWLHPDPHECADWSFDRMDELIYEIEVNPAYERFACGFKAPGWQVSDDCYAALDDTHWWMADQHLEDHRRPAGIPTYFYEDGGWHGHIQDVCGNGIEETWPRLTAAVVAETEFGWCSEHAH